MRVLVDTNIVLDYLLQREPFFHDADLLFQAIKAGQVIGYVSATTLTDIFYIARRLSGSLDLARQAVSETLNVMVVCPVNRAVLESAYQSGLADFEDAVQIACSETQGLEMIITRNIQDFTTSSVPASSIQELLQQLKA